MGAWTVRQVLECASPLALSDAIQSGRGLPQSKTLARGSTIPSVHGPDACTPCKETLHEPALTPALSHPIGEGVRRTGEGSLPAKFMAPMHVRIEIEALHEPGPPQLSPVRWER